MSRLASAERSWACSCWVSISTSTSPAFTREPDSKRTALTTPGRSAASITPWTGSALPPARRDCGHFCASSVSTTARRAPVTASGGGPLGTEAILSTISFALMPAKATMATITATMATMKRLNTRASVRHKRPKARPRRKMKRTPPRAKRILERSMGEGVGK